MTDNTITEAKHITDRAVAALWAFFTRAKPDGSQWGDVAGLSSEKEYAQSLAERPGKVGEACRMALSDPGMTPEEIAALKAFVKLDEASELTRRKER